MGGEGWFAGNMGGGGAGGGKGDYGDWDGNWLGVGHKFVDYTVCYLRKMREVYFSAYECVFRPCLLSSSLDLLSIYLHR